MSLAKKMMQLFAGLERAYGQYTLRPATQGDSKRQGRAATVQEQVTVEAWQSHLDGKTGIGIVPIKDDATCGWGAIDVDRYPVDIQVEELKLKSLDLPLIPCRTKSGGLHLFLFVQPGVPAQLVRSRLVEFANRLGFPGVEVFPKQVKLASERDTGNWLNMPYFDVGKTERYAVIAGKPVSAEEFIKRAEKLRVTQEQLESIVLAESSFDDGPPCLQTLAMQGGIPDGFRNNGLFAMGVYARMKYGDAWESELDKLHHQHIKNALPTREVITIVKSLNRKKYFYPCDKQPCVNNCDKATCKTREFGIGGGGDDFDVTVGQLIKLDTMPPTWITDVDGVRFELSTEELVSQERFRRVCVERINKLPNKVKPMLWEKFIKASLEKVEVQEAPPDSGPDGQFVSLLEQFCTTIAQARTKDELLIGKPWTDTGRTFFRSGDLQKYLHQQHFIGFTARQVWAVCKRMGAEHHQFQIKGKCVQCWSVAEFARQRDDFDVQGSTKGATF